MAHYQRISHPEEQPVPSLRARAKALDPRVSCGVVLPLVSSTRHLRAQSAPDDAARIDTESCIILGTLGHQSTEAHATNTKLWSLKGYPPQLQFIVESLVSGPLALYSVDTREPGRPPI